MRFSSLVCAAALLVTPMILMASSCSASSACDATSCADGCCGADGVCRPSAPTSCGLKGAACDDCTARRLGCIDGTCQEYQQGCVQNGSQCSLDAQCCGKICSKGVCSETRCESGGSPCSAGGECCSGLCEMNKCTTSSCGIAGNPCSAAEPCCAPLLCDSTSGVCVPPCKGATAQCTTPGECCSGQCINGACAASQMCRGQNDPCNNTNECCTGLTCQTGSCRA